MRHLQIGKHTYTTYLLGLFWLFMAISCREDHYDNVDPTESEEPKVIGVEQFSNKTEIATLAGGCFWCMEAPFEQIDGVRRVISGFSGGDEPNPAYEDVSAGLTGHREVVQVHFNPEIISFAEILDVYWKQFDPTDGDGSFLDRGRQYSPAIFVHAPSQKIVAEASKKALASADIFSDSILTPIEPFKSFFEAEDYHQDFYRREPFTYRNYRKESGRDEFIEAHWEVPKKENYPRPDSQELVQTLSFVQYGVTINNETESPFDNAYWDHTEAGIYVCLLTGAPLFSSADQYDAGTGWPSFTKPIDTRFLKKEIYEFGEFSEVGIRSLYGESHLGSSYYEGPEPTRIRYCINSAALRFIPLEEMYGTQYERYIWLVEPE